MRFLVIWCLVITFSLCNDYQKMYNKQCALCHGYYGELVYLNKVQPIIGIPDNERYNILLAYNAYNRNKYKLGALMQTVMGKIREREIRGLNNYINSLKDSYGK